MGVWVTGTIGDGALGLLSATGRLDDPSGFLAGRYRLPQPRLGLALHGIATAAMDVSDGLVQDLGHLCRASGHGATIGADSVPLSEPARAAGRLELCLTGGDDYELLLAVPPGCEQPLQAAARAARMQVTRIGRFHSGAADVTVLDRNGAPMTFAAGGWSHFA